MRLPVAVLAALVPSAARAAPLEDPGVFPAMLKMVGGLAVVLGILLGLYALSRRGRLFPSSRRGEIQIREIRHLGGKKAVCLLRVRGRDMLLGLGQDRIEMLSHLDREETESAFDRELSREKGE